MRVNQLWGSVSIIISMIIVARAVYCRGVQHYTTTGSQPNNTLRLRVYFIFRLSTLLLQPDSLHSRLSDLVLPPGTLGPWKDNCSTCRQSPLLEGKLFYVPSAQRNIYNTYRCGRWA